MDKKLIYIADDEIRICSIIKSFLIKEGFDAETFYTGNDILKAFIEKPADMLIIDIMMPGMDGYSLCSSIRELSNVPIIIVSAKDSELDKIAGLTLGSDDYLSKPFSPMELVARVKSIFRRIELDKRVNQSNDAVNISDLIIYPDKKHIQCGTTNVNLTMMEFNLLLYLARNKDKAISRNELLQNVWGFETEVETRATDDMIKRIRKKLTDAGSSLKIETIWGFGFKICSKE